MKNNTHNLVHALARELDHLWERHDLYVKDAEEAACQSCKDMWHKLAQAKEDHANMIRDELAKHAKDGTLD